MPGLFLWDSCSRVLWTETIFERFCRGAGPKRGGSESTFACQGKYVRFRRTRCIKCRRYCLPFRACHELVEVFPALLAKVLIRAGSFLHDAYAPTMLPDLADIALDE